MTLYSVRSERHFCERLECALPFKWFMDLNLEGPPFDACSFSKNRERLLSHDGAGRFMQPGWWEDRAIRALPTTTQIV